MYSRFEHDVVTGVVTEIAQRAYKNLEDHIIVIDANEDAPEGYLPYEPTTEA